MQIYSYTHILYKCVCVYICVYTLNVNTLKNEEIKQKDDWLYDTAWIKEEYHII